jgi:serine phosphatase RsbU (regulator of sigma subunit)
LTVEGDEGMTPRRFDPAVHEVPARVATSGRHLDAVPERAPAELEQELADALAVTGVLERSLMPDELPELDRVGLAAVYRPAAGALRVGGDFYDAFVAGGSLVLAVGDVVGKGPEAAAKTALVRHMLRALTLYETRPATLLDRLRDALRTHGGEGAVCTLVLAVMSRPRSARRITIASAGHPLPLRVSRNGSAEEVGATNPMLHQAVRGRASEEQTVRLRRGDRLFLYTDGLTDAQAPERQLSVSELHGALAGREQLPLADLLRNVVGWAAGPTEPRDDIAILGLERR